MSLLGVGAMLSAQQETRMASNFRTAIAAFYAAETGIEQAVINHRNDTITTTLSDSTGSTQYNTTVSEASGRYTVQSEGVHNHSGARYTIHAILSGTPGATPQIEQWSNRE